MRVRRRNTAIPGQLFPHDAGISFSFDLNQFNFAPMHKIIITPLRPGEEQPDVSRALSKRSTLFPFIDSPREKERASSFRCRFAAQFQSVC